MLAILVVNTALISGALPSVLPEAFAPDARRHFRHWLLSPQSAGDDSWLPMAQARAHWLSDSDKPLYTKIFFEDKKKFQYPPSSLFLVVPLGAVLDDENFEKRSAVILNLVSWPFLLVVLLSAGFIFATRWRSEHDGQSPPPLFPIAVIVLACFFYPLTRSFNLGQAQTILNGLLALMLVGWVLGRERFAGVCLGVACLVKPQLGVIFIWGLIRRRWEFVVAAAVVGATGLLASLVVFGWANHLDYAQAVSFMGRHGESYHANQSVNGLMHRLLGTAPPMVFDPHAFPPFHPVVYVTTLATSAVLVGLCLFLPVSRAKSGSIHDLAIAVLTSIMASPIAWEHHYGSVILIYALLLPTALRRLSTSGTFLVLLALSLVLTSHRLNLFEHLGAGFSLLYSYRFFGALLLLGLLYSIRASRSAEPA